MKRGIFPLLVVIAILTGAWLAFADDTVKPAPAISPSTSISGSISASSAAVIATSSPTVVTPLNYSSGIAPMPSGSATPKDWLPPGSEDPDPGPSLAVFPGQRIATRMNHATHVGGQKLKCVYCHVDATKSVVSSDLLLPKKHERCIGCHAIDDNAPLKESSPPARCDFCHVGAKIDPATKAVTVTKLGFVAPNLKMNHKAHADQKIACETCHGEVGKLELATRDQLPRMKGCFNCHQGGDAGGIGANANAKSSCLTCHVADASNVVMQTMFTSGVLTPPKWLKNSKHGSDWIERHKKVAGADSQYCGNCHREQECDDCHNGKTKPQSVHPNDFLNIHEIEARLDPQKCTSCHSTTSFCVQCHTRVGVAESSPQGVATSIRFHPPASVWSGPIKKAGHHAFEAEKNITSCVSCHVERDCVSCHGTTGVGGAGYATHPLGFKSKCASMYSKNPRPCFVCHDPYDPQLAACK